LPPTVKVRRLSYLWGISVQFVREQFAGCMRGRDDTLEGRYPSAGVFTAIQLTLASWSAKVSFQGNPCEKNAGARE